MLKNYLSKIREMQRVGFFQFIKKRGRDGGGEGSLNVVSVPLAQSMKTIWDFTAFHVSL